MLLNMLVLPIATKVMPTLVGGLPLEPIVLVVETNQVLVDSQHLSTTNAPIAAISGIGKTIAPSLLNGGARAGKEKAEKERAKERAKEKVGKVKVKWGMLGGELSTLHRGKARARRPSFDAS